MKMVIHCGLGYFKLPKKFCELYGVDEYDPIDRMDKDLISYIEANGNNDSDCSNLYVVEIPDTATDWDIDSYDGIELITYVVDGKLHYAS